MIKLYDYFRSSASYRVRIALELKKIPYELEEVHLIRDGGQQYHEDYTRLNPQQRVPTLVDDDLVLTQSTAILQYLEDQYPKPRLLPDDSKNKYKILSFINIIACDVHPLNNLSVLNYLKDEFQIDEQQKLSWYHHWIEQGFQAIELQLASSKGSFSFGNDISLADIYLIPQVYNAIRFNLAMEKYPLILEIYNACNQLDAFQKASPQVH
ncbi:maleylacetoacetate isomerase [Thiotrichales bacterium 19S9-12]|nr:maleylacetoacetate isomerase [Thiotrichales bacterium 19S9-11]MCF6811758.1 maleylacetoacetate isomerase [Thiotrichales bacterium 19S9-12]